MIMPLAKVRMGKRRIIMVLHFLEAETIYRLENVQVKRYTSQHKVYLDKCCRLHSELICMVIKGSLKNEKQRSIYIELTKY